MNKKTNLIEDKIWLSSPHMGENEIKFIHKAFEENWIAPLGPNVTGFEDDLEKYLDQEIKVASLTTGTAAVHLALIKLGVGQGDEVICQSLTFAASANPIIYQNATPIFIDSEMDTWNMCPLALEDALVDRLRLGKKVKAIIVVHLYGMPAKIDEILSVARKYNVPVIEDAAEALGSTYKSQKCGTFGTFGVLSFNGNKIITTSGGGALICPDQQTKNEIIHLATQARDNAPHYEHSRIGFNYRMSNISLQLEPSEDFFSNYWLSAIIINPEISQINAEDLRQIFEDRNIEVRHLWKPMHLQPVYREFPYYGGHVAEKLFQQGLCLPSGSNLTDDHKKRIAQVIESVFEKKDN